MTKKLSHLSQEQIDDLIKRYYAGEKVSDLITEFEIDVNPGTLIKHFPPEVSEEKCIYCDTPYIRDRVSKSYLSYRWRGEQETFYCPECTHSLSANCQCPQCNLRREEIRIKAMEERQSTINELVIIDSEDAVDYQMLDFDERIYLGVLLREGVSEDFSYINALASFSSPFTPTSELTHKVFEKLLKGRIIKLHPNSPHEHIHLPTEETNEVTFDMYYVNWHLNIKDTQLSQQEMIDELMIPPAIEAQHYEQAFDMWQKIAIHECVEYIQYNVERTMHSNYPIGKKTESVLCELLTTFSTAQIFGMLFRATNNALRFMAEKSANRRHAINTIIGNALSYGERAKLNDWKIVKYNRVTDRPESALSKFLFDKTIPIGKRGFSESPSIKLIEEAF